MWTSLVPKHKSLELKMVGKSPVDAHVACLGKLVLAACTSVIPHITHMNGKPTEISQALIQNTPNTPRAT